MFEVVGTHNGVKQTKRFSLREEAEKYVNIKKNIIGFDDWDFAINDITAEYNQEQAEKTDLDNEFDNLRQSALDAIDAGTIFSSLSTPEKRVIKALIRLAKR